MGGTQRISASATLSRLSSYSSSSFHRRGLTHRSRSRTAGGGGHHAGALVCHSSAGIRCAGGGIQHPGRLRDGLDGAAFGW